MQNVIIDSYGNIYGFYNDVLEYLKAEIIGELQNNNFDVISPFNADLLDELKALSEYDGIIKVSDKNGMGNTAEKYVYNEN